MSAPKPLPAIKPCWRCGDKKPFAYEQPAMDRCYVFCDRPTCTGVQGPFRKTKRAAITAWNRRAPT